MRTGQARLAEAQSLLEEARAVWGRVEVTYGQPFDAYLRYYLGSAALVQGDLAAAGAHLEASLRDLGTAEDDLARGVVLGNLGVLAALRGEHAEARARFAAGLPLLRGGVDLWDLGLLLLNFGLEEAQAGSPVADELLTEALRTWQQLRSRPGMALALAGLGEVAANGGQPQRAGSCSARPRHCSRRPRIRCFASPCPMTCPTGWPPPALAVTRRPSTAAWPRERAGRWTGRSTRVWPARHVRPKPRPEAARR